MMTNAHLRHFISFSFFFILNMALRIWHGLKQIQVSSSLSVVDSNDSLPSSETCNLQECCNYENVLNVTNLASNLKLYINCNWEFLIHPLSSNSHTHKPILILNKKLINKFHSYSMTQSKTYFKVHF